jgi:hypothetical protein
MRSLGSYFSPQGATIKQAIGALGEYLDAGDGGMAPPWAGAYDDGSFAHGRDYTDVGERQAFRDGSLGEFADAPMFARAGAFDEGVLGGARGDVWTSDEGGADPGPLQSWYDGTLGRGYGSPTSSGRAARYDAPPGSRAAEQAEAPTAVDTGGGLDTGPIQSWHDGVLGSGCSPLSGCSGTGEYYGTAASGIGLPLYIDGKPLDTATTITHDPNEADHPLHINGQAHYEPLTIRHGRRGFYGRMHDKRDMKAHGHMSGLGRYSMHEWRDGSLGAVPDPKVVDLQNVDTIKEVRSAIAFFVPEVAMAGGGASDSAWVGSPIWTDKDDAIWAAAIKKITGLSATYKEGDLSQSSGGHHYPTPLGLSVVLALGVGAPTGPQGPAWFGSTFPILHAFLVAVIANKGSTSGFKVNEPFFSTTELVRGGKSTFAGFSTTTLAVAGLGVAALVAGVVAFKKKRR